MVKKKMIANSYLLSVVSSGRVGRAGVKKFCKLLKNSYNPDKQTADP